MLSVSGTTLQGAGPATILHFTPPTQGTQKHCVNDRVLTTRCALSTTVPLQVAANITLGALSFEAANAADVANLGAGDWIYLANWDPGIADAHTHTSYATTVDWAQVASVSGTTVTVTEPFRQAFSTSLPFSAGMSGISFQKILLTQNITIQDLSISVDSVATSAPAVGIAILSTLNATVRNVAVMTSNGQPIYTEGSKGATFDNVTAQGNTLLDEFASSVDLTIENSTFAISNAPGIGLDLGTAFFTVTHNSIPLSANAGIYALYNVHQGSISDNTIAPVGTTGGAARSIGILIEGSPNIRIADNALAGGMGTPSVGLLFAPYATAQLPEPDTGDVASGNTVQGFTTKQVGP